MQPRDIISRIEGHARIPDGAGERFAGYAVIGLPFQSGHILALRRFPASSLGPGYTSVWHRDPEGHWTFYSTVAPEQSCSRYFSNELEGSVTSEIQIEWDGPESFHLEVRGARPLTWALTLHQPPAARLMNAAARLVPDAWWKKRVMLDAMAIAGRCLLGVGRMNLTGRTPNGQGFIANPQQVWLVKSSRAVVDGVDVGPPGALAQQARLNEFVIPQRGVFAVARAFLEEPAGARVPG